MEKIYDIQVTDTKRVVPPFFRKPDTTLWSLYY